MQWHLTQTPQHGCFESRNNRFRTLFALASVDVRSSDLHARLQISVRKTMNTRKPQVQPKKKSEEKAVEEMQTICETETVVEEWEEVQIDDLVIELESMRAAMYQLEAKNAQLEDKIREEVCEEMMKQMEAMEQAFQVRIEDERIAAEQKFKRKLQIISREITRREEAMTAQVMPCCCSWRFDQCKLFSEFKVSEMQAKQPRRSFLKKGTSSHVDRIRAARGQKK